jgi:signal transduction histidine kinase
VIQNAMEASIGFPKQIHISTAVKKGMLQIGIEDNGIGIDPKINNRIFEPFFSTKMRAVGLGLTQAQRILTSHNGVINIQPLEKGTLLLMQIPLVYEEEC